MSCTGGPRASARARWRSSPACGLAARPACPEAFSISWGTDGSVPVHVIATFSKSSPRSLVS
eukprot:14081411-Alexandrium_andersonii.AAC.1